MDLNEDNSNVSLDLRLKLQQLNLASEGTGSFQKSFKDLYCLLQGLSKDATMKPPQKLIDDLYLYLLALSKSNKLTPDIILVFSSCIILILPWVDPDPKKHFKKLLASNAVVISSENTSVDSSSFPGFVESTEEISFNGLIHRESWTKSIKPQWFICILVHGLVNVKPHWLYEPSDETNHLSNLLFEIWPLVAHIDSSYTYQSSQVLSLWLKRIDSYLSTDSTQSVCPLCNESSFLGKIFSISPTGQLWLLLNQHWENPVKGVSAIMRDCCSYLLSLHDRQMKGHVLSVAHDIVQKVMEKAAWETKASFGLIQICLPYFTSSKVLENYPELPEHLSNSLRTYQLCSVATSLYKDLCSLLNADQWQKYFYTEHLNSISSQERNVRRYYLTLWIPWTLSKFPVLVRSLAGSCNITCTKGLLAQMSILVVAKGLGLSDSSPSHLSLTHEDDEVRATAFELLITSKQTTHPVTDEEAEIFKSFLEDNLSIDCSAFRHSLSKSVVMLLHRLKAVLGSKNGHNNITCKNLVLWLHEFLLLHLSLIGNYSRISTCLHLYVATIGICPPTTPSTRILLALCTHNMSDIREMASQLLHRVNLGDREELEKWRRVAHSMVNSPRSSEADGGATLYRVLFLRHQDREDLLMQLYREALLQFRDAQTDIVKAAVHKPIHGVVQAFNECLLQAEPEIVRKIAPDAIAFYVRLVQFSLTRLGAKNNSAVVSPSFLDMGESIDASVASCPSAANNTPSNAAQLVLSFCWLVLKVCCSSASALVIRWNSLLATEEVMTLVDDVALKILLWTRHKGAMEAAQEALSRICLNLSSDKEEAVQRKLLTIIGDLPNMTNVSVTRRAAGLAMIFGASCQAFDKDSFTTNVGIRLISFARLETDLTCDLNDSTRSLSLHLLTSILPCEAMVILHADVCIVCLEAFNSDSWAVRNAALQLWGVLVPCLLGPKKVKEDSSSLNSVIAVEFCHRHPRIIRALADHLEECSRTNATAVQISLVPILCLLSRLNGTCPPTGEYVEADIVLNKVIGYIWAFLGHPSFGVRKLSATTLGALSKPDQLYKHLRKGFLQDNCRSNLVNGLLLLALVARPKGVLIEDEILRMVLCRACPFNRALILEKLLVHEEQQLLLEECGIPGSFRLAHLSFKRRLERVAEEGNSLLSFLKVNFDLWPSECCEFLQEQIDIQTRLDGQNFLWRRFAHGGEHCLLRCVSSSLRVILKKDVLNVDLKVPMKEYLVDSSGLLAQNCLVLTAHLLDYRPDLEVLWTNALGNQSCRTEEYRLAAAEAMAIAASKDCLPRFWDTLIKISLQLLQDENVSVRSSMDAFVEQICCPSRTPTCRFPQQAMTNLRAITDHMVARSIETKDFEILIEFFLWGKNDSDKGLLFDCLSKNCYREPILICHLINEALRKQLKESLVSLKGQDNNIRLEESLSRICKQRSRLLKEQEIESDLSLLIDKNVAQCANLAKEIDSFLQMFQLPNKNNCQ